MTIHRKIFTHIDSVPSVIISVIHIKARVRSFMKTDITRAVF